MGLPLPSDVGECTGCGARNSKRASICHSCHGPLPWAKAKARPQAQAPTGIIKSAVPTQSAAATQPLDVPVKKPQPARNDVQNVNDDEWWESIGRGLLCFVLAAVFYFLLAAKEASGGYIVGRWWLVLLYAIGGKWLVAGVLGALGILFIGYGISQYREGKS